MQAPRATTPARTLCRIAASFAVLSTLLACGYKGPLYMPPPPMPEESLTTPPAPASLPAADSTDRTNDTDAAAPSPVQAQ